MNTIVNSFKLKYIFTGNPCGGTSFTANYMTFCGLPCGHEMLDYVISEQKWYSGADLDENGNRFVENALGESSYTAIEWCDNHPLDKLPIIMILRNPVKVLCSMIAKAIASGETLDINHLINQIIARYKKIETHPRLAFKFRIEFEEDLKKLCNFIGLEYKAPKKINSRIHNLNRINLEPSDLLAFNSCNKLIDFANKHGYDCTNLKKKPHVMIGELQF